MPNAHGAGRKPAPLPLGAARAGFVNGRCDVSLPLRLVLPPLRVPFDTRSVPGREGQPAELELERVMGIEHT